MKTKEYRLYLQCNELNAFQTIKMINNKMIF